MLQSYNCYLVESDDAVVLIDGIVHRDTAWEAFQEVLKANGFTFQDITAVLLTHHHNDHTGIIPMLLEHVTVPIYAHPLAHLRIQRDVTFLTERITFMTELYAKHGCEQARIVAEKERLEKMYVLNRHERVSGDIRSLQEGEEIFGFQVLEVPGHTPDHLLFYDATREVAFVGDFLLRHMQVNALIDIHGENQRMFRSLANYEQSLHKMKNHPIQVAYSGHGNVIKNVSHRIERTLANIETQSERVLAKLAEGQQTAAQIAQSLYGATYAKHFPFVMSEVIGHLDRLESRGAVTCTCIDGVYHYTIN